MFDESRDDRRRRVSAGQHVEAEELEAAPARLVELPHPLDEVQEFLRLPIPGGAREHSLRVAPPGEEVLVHAVGLGHVLLDGEEGETHVGGEVLDDAALHLEELVRATRDFAQRHDAGIADDGAQRCKVAIGATGLAGGEGPRKLPEPLDRRAADCRRSGAAGHESAENQADDASPQPEWCAMPFTAESTVGDMMAGERFRRGMIEIALLTGMVLVLVASLLMLRKRPGLPKA